MIQSQDIRQSPTQRATHTSSVKLFCKIVVLAIVVFAYENADAGETADADLDMGFRLDAGFAHYDADKLNLTSGAQLRRMRATARWNLTDNWRLYWEAGVRSVYPNTQGMWVQYRPSPYLKVNAGLIPVPFGLDWQTSSSNGIFAERALTIALTERYQTGISTNLRSKHRNIRFGVFTNNPFDSANDQTYGWSVAGTFTSRIWAGDSDRLYGLVSLQYRRPDEPLRLRARPETRVSGQRLVDTGVISGVDSVLRSGIGLIYTQGSRSLVAEYIQARLAGTTKHGGVFAGWYVQGSWLLTGESRNFSGKRGAFRRVTPQRRFGAWELGIRVSNLDLNDNGITGGFETNYTLGLNWYVSRNIRLLANYTLARANPNRKQVVDNPEILQFLVQMVF